MSLHKPFTEEELAPILEDFYKNLIPRRMRANMQPRRPDLRRTLFVAQRFWPYLNYHMPDYVLEDADERLLRVLGKHPEMAYG